MTTGARQFRALRANGQPASRARRAARTARRRAPSRSRRSAPPPAPTGSSSSAAAHVAPRSGRAVVEQRVEHLRSSMPAAWMRVAYSRRWASEIALVGREHLGEAGDDRQRRAQVVAQAAARRPSSRTRSSSLGSRARRCSPRAARSRSRARACCASSLVIALRMWVLTVSAERNEPLGHLLAGEALGEQVHDLALALGQRRHAAASPCARAAPGAGAGRRRCRRRRPSRARRQLARRALLERVAARAGVQPADQQLDVARARVEHDAALRVGVEQLRA